MLTQLHFLEAESIWQPEEKMVILRFIDFLINSWNKEMIQSPMYFQRERKWCNQSWEEREAEEKSRTLVFQLWQDMKALQEFQCFRNRITKARRPGITGTIPRSVGFVTNLQIFMVFQNGLSGTLPSDMGQMASLARLDVELNYLNGTVPSELGNLGNLTILQIGKTSGIFLKIGRKC